MSIRELTTPKSRHDYLMVREDEAAREGFDKGVVAACLAIRGLASTALLKGRDDEVDFLRDLERNLPSLVDPGAPRTKYDRRHLDHAIRVLNADDEDAEPLPAEDEV